MEILLAKTNKSIKIKLGKNQGRNKVKSREFDSYSHANAAVVTQFLCYNFTASY